MASNASTHWKGCGREGGPRHYLCLLWEIAGCDAEIMQLRAVLEWAATILTADREGPGIAWRYMPDELRAAARGDWPAVRAAGVALPGEGD